MGGFALPEALLQPRFQRAVAQKSVKVHPPAPFLPRGTYSPKYIVYQHFCHRATVFFSRFRAPALSYAFDIIECFKIFFVFTGQISQNRLTSRISTVIL